MSASNQSSISPQVKGYDKPQDPFKRIIASTNPYIDTIYSFTEQQVLANIGLWKNVLPPF